MNVIEQTFKIYINKIKEDWIVDRLKKEFIKLNDSLVTKNQRKADLIWIIAPWTWKSIKKKFLITKKVICTIHHIDEDKFLNETKKDFYERDEYVDLYHATSPMTYSQLKKYTKKEIKYLPFWIDEKNWFYIQDKEKLRKKYNFSSNDYIVGSFQRDSEGFDKSLPKLSKGPDRFIEIIKYYQEHNKNLIVLLSGKRRDYIINELNKLEIRFKYFEMVNPTKMNELYNLLNLYIVSSRVEGGPFSIYESAITKTPIISTDVGIAKEILSPNSIYSFQDFKYAEPNIEFAYNKIQEFIPDKVIPNYLKIMKELYES